MQVTRGIPDAFRSSEKLAGRLKVGLAEALADLFNESDWKMAATLHGFSRRLDSNSRFYRSLSFNDPDYKGYVVDLVRHLFLVDGEAFAALFERPDVQEWLQAHGQRDIVEVWKGATDPLVSALAHGLSEVRASQDVVDLDAYATRIADALPADPHDALGATKDMLEATMRSILRKRGETDFEKLDFPGLTGRCFTLLGMAPNTPPATPSDKYLRKMASSARSMIESANELRNLAGTGHGRVVGEEVPVSADDASLVGSSGLVLAAWLLRRHQTAL
ncbi:abortive infection family protein [Methylorubrum populi]|uniref:abortive infection family protein n=1 Tax=Methylorubrum TaxID=2282523 RepID=UPI0016495672|nr:abortive infection family protein [Methylorubrum populi]